MNEADKDKLKVVALGEKIGQLVSNYENQIADFRAQSTLVIQELNNRIAELEQIVSSHGEETVDATPQEIESAD